ncbi:ABC transporter substrate-binding protein [Thalassomonas actiniarum]|uniref:Carbohydrate ABC transporter substrate-binding protein n=1 Tax=Thalassomonas actiniarum TaxID=485447 RepID=A0AAE9YTW1_9GAMM|nr:ABC transporter substrate-binding protein [Thalassomonas actiniarum]WDE00723.1 carbohydrate ABC transporter substrate-binding protein [Thalassomonas actiniarum]
MIKALLMALLIVNSLAGQAFAATQDSHGIKSARTWIEKEFTVSSISREQQVDEMRWFIEAAKPYRDIEVRVVSERIATHLYEANTLARAFFDITGIRVIHEITGEDDVIKKIQTQIELGIPLYDMYINDSDFIGSHYRSGAVIALSDFIAGAGKTVTLPTLDLADFIGLPFTTGPDGKLYQLPDQQFANLYWYRHDWFSRPALKKQFKQRYGYELNVPVNWSAYEDIAEFFTVHVKQIDGVRVYGHMDYGKMDPSLGWRFSDAWLSMAGVGDPGLPNGLPVDEWGIRLENCHPVGASVARGGALNSPAAVYALTKFIHWLEQYAPPDAKHLDFTGAGAWAGKGQIAQQIFWYSAFTAALLDPRLPVTDDNGHPKWRMAPSPRGPYWQPGMKLGYQDVGGWTMLTGTPLKRRQAAWLYAQFVVSKTVSLKKFLVGLTPVRHSDIFSGHISEVAGKYAGLVDFYRSNARKAWTPTGINVPDYPGLADLWWKHAGLAVHHKISAKQAMDQLALAMDERLLAIAGKGQKKCQPKLNTPKSELYWLARPGAPKPKLINEKPGGETRSYRDSLKNWR